ncbi:hypothetical protein BVC71_13385 [Marivivens niveibacter]|uniref:Uncharacterized protein n=1 Tax=Marivivens niveibacter TaxID=1930667 RepID=A0A251WVL6_9RHOB|nr:hypothetical protein BVC71_13385 [Marivivens niveibacter]
MVVVAGGSLVSDIRGTTASWTTWAQIGHAAVRQPDTKARYAVGENGPYLTFAQFSSADKPSFRYACSNVRSSYSIAIPSVAYYAEVTRMEMTNMDHALAS